MRLSDGSDSYSLLGEKLGPGGEAEGWMGGLEWLVGLWGDKIAGEATERASQRNPQENGTLSILNQAD